MLVSPQLKQDTDSMLGLMQNIQVRRAFILTEGFAITRDTLPLTLFAVALSSYLGFFCLDSGSSSLCRLGYLQLLFSQPPRLRLPSSLLHMLLLCIGPSLCRCHLGSDPTAVFNTVLLSSSSLRLYSLLPPRLSYSCILCKLSCISTSRFEHNPSPLRSLPLLFLPLGFQPLLLDSLLLDPLCLEHLLLDSLGLEALPFETLFR